MTGSEKEQKIEKIQESIEEETPKIDKGKGKAKAIEPTEEDDGEDDDEDEEDEDEDEDDIVRTYFTRREDIPVTY